MKLVRDIVVLIVFIIGAAVYFVFNKPHRNVVDEKAAYSLTLFEINAEFLRDEEAAFEKYFNKVIEISGTASSIIKKEDKRYDLVIESSGVFANGEVVQANRDLISMIDKEVNLKGLFIGYDNLLEEIKLSECSIKQIKQ